MSEPTGIPDPSPDLAGYPDTGSLVQGYRQSGAEAQRQKARADAAEQQLQALMTANQRQVPPQNHYDPGAELETLGIPVRALDAYVENKVQGRIAEAFGPIAAGFTARGKVLAEHPDYGKYEQDVASFINSDPQTAQAYNKMFNVDPVAAMEYAYLKFGDNRRRAAPSPNGSPEQAVHAAIPSARSGEARQGRDPGDNIRAAYERYQQTGSPRDAVAYAKARLKNVITDEFLNQ
jgi:hypothetical protein